MDYLRQGIHLRGYAQKDYRYEYKREAFELFAAMLERVKFETASLMANVEVRTQEELEREEEERRERLMRALQAQHAEAGSLLAGAAEAGPPPGLRGAAAERRDAAVAMPPMAEPAAPFVRDERKVGRNEPCPVRLGQEVQALPRRALERRVSTAACGAAHRHSGDPRGRRSPLRRARAGADRRAAAGQAHGRPLGVPRRQGRTARERARSPRARACRKSSASRCTLPHPSMRLTPCLPRPRGRAVAVDRQRLYAESPAPLDGQHLKWVAPAALAGEDILEADRPFVEALRRAARP